MIFTCADVNHNGKNDSFQNISGWTLLVHNTLVHVGDAIAVVDRAESMMQSEDARIESS